MNRNPYVMLAIAGAGALACSKPASTGQTASVQSGAQAASVERPAATALEQAGVKLCEHQVPAELCTRCAPELAEVFKAQGDWCNEHGLPESHCRKCNPNLTFTAQAVSGPKEPWCKEHAVPEAKCTKCNPKLVAKFVAAGDFCREHGFPESVCPYCHPEVARAAGKSGPQFPPPGTKVTLASPEIARRAGIETVRAESRPFAHSLDVVGRLDFNQNRLAQLSARGDALVVEVKVDIGDQVKAGQPLVVLTSAGVGETQGRLAGARARLEAARAAVAREERLTERGISPRKALDEAKAALAAAEGENAASLAGLRSAGASGGGVGGRYSLKAPFAGVVVARDAVAGRSAGPGEVLIKVADLTTMWALLDVPEESAALVKPGQKVTVHFEGAAAGNREAVVSRVGAAVDPRTRTVEVRVDLPNPEGSLKAGHFLRGSIEVSSPKGALLVPRDAIQQAQGRDIVFVRTSPTVFEPVVVELGPRQGEHVAVMSGLRPGEELVTTGAFLLKTEILKDSIGAGCADDH